MPNNPSPNPELAAIAQVKAQIREAQQAGDLDREMQLLAQLEALPKPPAKTVADAYGQMA